MTAENFKELLLSLGERIRKIRRTKGLTIEKLGERSGINPKYVGYIERGQRNVTVRNIMAIADALDVPISSLFSAGVHVPGHRSEQGGLESRVKETGETGEDLVDAMTRKEAEKELMKVLRNRDAAFTRAAVRLVRLLSDYGRKTAPR